jgi:aldehyde dehydrogenase (NAD+)
MTTQPDRPAAEREVQTAIDRIVHYAGWTDKYGPLLGSVNPVASSHFNFTLIEPMGIVGVIAPEESPLLGLLSMILPAITSGNAVVALASQAHPYPSILLGEMLAVSDLPSGVVNVLTGARPDILPTMATHEHIRAVYACADRAGRTEIQKGCAESVKRAVFLDEEKTIDWHSESAQGLEKIRSFVESKTVWHPVGN